MTRPMTKAQLSTMAVPIGRQRCQDSFIPFLLNVMALGAGAGIGGSDAAGVGVALGSSALSGLLLGAGVEVGATGVAAGVDVAGALPSGAGSALAVALAPPNPAKNSGFGLSSMTAPTAPPPASRATPSKLTSLLRFGGIERACVSPRRMPWLELSSVGGLCGGSASGFEPE